VVVVVVVVVLVAASAAIAEVLPQCSLLHLFAVACWRQPSTTHFPPVCSWIFLWAFCPLEIILRANRTRTTPSCTIQRVPHRKCNSPVLCPQLL